MRRGALSVLVAIGVAQLQLAADCEDGVTPDCSDAAAQCGPDLGGDASPAPDGALDAGAPDA